MNESTDIADANFLDAATTLETVIHIWHMNSQLRF